MQTDSPTFIDFFTQHASLPFFVLKRNGVILRTNLYTERLLGQPLTGLNFQDIIVDFHGVFDLTKVINKSEQSHLLNLQLQNDLPHTFYFNFMLSNDGIYAFGQPDLEEVEAIRNEILTLNLELSNLTRELHKKNAQLQQLNEEKNRFLGMAAHDLRKPIGLLTTYSEFLIDEAGELLGEEHMGFLKTIHSSCTFMQRLVDDFLDVSAIEAGRFELDLQPAVISKVLSNSLRLNNLQARKKGIDVEVNCQKNIPSILMDSAKIEQAITNLIANAIEHSRPGSLVIVHLTIDGSSIAFSVADQGPGISSNDQKKLFKPFQKTSSKKTVGEKSTGLGLLITRKIIEAHGGELGLKSKVGEGTTMTFNLPVSPEKK